MDSPNSNGSDSPTNNEQQQQQQYAQEQEQNQQIEEEESNLNSSFFPAPSHYYKLYTMENLSLPLNTPLTLPSTSSTSNSESITTTTTTNDLLPPVIDWIIERGSYTVFGQTWPVEEVLPSLSELGLQELFSKDQDRSQSLLILLRALLLNYTSLISSLLSPPPSLLSQQSTQQNGSGEAEETKTDPERIVEHIRLICINMHHLINELRPVQARETLKNMMRSQIDARKAKTLAIKKKIAELRTNLSNVKSELSSDCTNIDIADINMELNQDVEIELSEKERRRRDFERLKEAVDLLG